MADKFKLAGIEYEIPEEFDLGELCDMEQHFGVVFDEDAPPSVRQTAATLWIAVRRVQPDFRPEQIRSLKGDDLARITAEISASREPVSDDPLASNASKNGTTGEGSESTSAITRDRLAIGSRGSDTGSPE